MSKNFKKEKQETKKTNTNTKRVCTYSKKFEYFADGVEELRELNPLFEEILYKDDYDDNAPAVSADKMLEAFNKHFPTVDANRFWSINISSTRCTLKTDKKLSFGWKLKYKSNNGDAEIYDIEFLITVFGTQDEFEEKLIENNWTTDNSTV